MPLTKVNKYILMSQWTERMELFKDRLFCHNFQINERILAITVTVCSQALGLRHCFDAQRLAAEFAQPPIPLEMVPPDFLSNR